VLGCLYFQLLNDAGNCLISWLTISFSNRTLLHGVSLNPFKNMVPTCNIFFNVKTIGVGSRTSSVASHNSPTLHLLLHTIPQHFIYCFTQFPNTSSIASHNSPTLHLLLHTIPQHFICCFTQFPNTSKILLNSILGFADRASLYNLVKRTKFS